MRNARELRCGRSCVFALHVHLVFVTKYRRDVLARDTIGCLQEIFAKVCFDFPAKLRACDGGDDHVHLLIEYPPTVEVSVLVNSVKGVSSRLLKQHRSDIARRYWKGTLWSPSYFAATCDGPPVDMVRQYVEQQRAYH
jgi:putative transposase